MDNDELLRRNGVLFPKTGRFLNMHYPYSFALGLGGKKEVAPADLMSDLAKEVAASGLQRVVISSENFVMARFVSAVKDLFSDYDVTVIVFIRRHDHAFKSAYSQAAKSGELPVWAPDIKSYILYSMARGQVPFNYLATLRLWADVFGIENIRVQPFESAQLKPDLYSVFLKLIDIQPGAPLTLPDLKNPSASYAGIVAIDSVFRSSAPEQMKRQIVRKLIVADQAASKPGPENLISPQDRRSIIALYDPSYALIAREFLGRSNGVLFEEKPPAKDADATLPAPPTPQELADMLLNAASSVIEESKADKRGPASAGGGKWWKRGQS